MRTPSPPLLTGMVRSRKTGEDSGSVKPGRPGLRIPHPGSQGKAVRQQHRWAGALHCIGDLNVISLLHRHGVSLEGTGLYRRDDK
jgi:hypothetical protein